MTTLTADPQYNIYSARQGDAAIIILQRTSDSQVLVAPDYGYATGRMIDNYSRTFDTLVFGEMPSDIMDVTYQASFSIENDS